jgi:hypothetical protein
LASPLSKQKTSIGNSICYPCLQFCQGQGYWPVSLPDGTKCI